jgi:hypothetical protein
MSVAGAPAFIAAEALAHICTHSRSMPLQNTSICSTGSAVSGRLLKRYVVGVVPYLFNLPLLEEGYVYKLRHQARAYPALHRLVAAGSK